MIKSGEGYDEIVEDDLEIGDLVLKLPNTYFG